MDEQPTLTIPAQRGAHRIAARVARSFGFGTLMQRSPGRGPHSDHDIVVLTDKNFPTRQTPISCDSPGTKIFRRGTQVEIHVPIDREAVLQLA